jgi:hypothetical protein
MKLKGVNYDVGRILMGYNMRPVFDLSVIRRELQIIKEDLHCNSVKIQGYEISNVMSAAKEALDLGFSNVWLAPEMFDHSKEETLAYTVKAAEEAEKVRLHSQDKELVFSVGTELTAFMQGIAEGNSMSERLFGPNARKNWLSGKYVKLLNDYLQKVSKGVRDAFGGKITYASLPLLETVEWSPFDYVCVDAYQDKRRSYAELVGRFLEYGKPVVIGEFGCCTFRGAADLGGMGWDIVDFTKMPPQLKGDYVYDQKAQADALLEQLGILDLVGVDGAFVFTFVQPLNLSKDPAIAEMLRAVTFDPDISSYSLVKSFYDRYGTTYPDMTWEPKESFRAVADYYSKIAM